MLSPIILSPNMDKNTLINALNNMFRQIEAENRTKIIKDSNGNIRIIIGYYKNGF